MDQLEQTKKTVTAVLISFDMADMDPYRVRILDPHLPSWSGGELYVGTHVRCMKIIYVRFFSKKIG